MGVSAEFRFRNSDQEGMSSQSSEIPDFAIIGNVFTKFHFRNTAQLGCLHEISLPQHCSEGNIHNYTHSEGVSS